MGSVRSVIYFFFSAFFDWLTLLVGLSALEIALIGMGLAVFVLLVMLALYLYRRVVLPWRKRRKYAAILEDSENRTPVVPKAPE